MSDNVAITAGTGTTVGTDERTINSTAVQIQRVDEQGSTSFAQGQVSVDTTGGGVTIIAARETRKAAVIVNRGTIAIYVGSGSVTTANGFQLNPNDSVRISTTAAIKGITASSTATAHYIEEFDA